VNLARQIQTQILALFALSALVFLGALFLADQGAVENLKNLYLKVASSEADRRDLTIATAALETLRPVAAQINDRQADLIEQVQKLAASSGVRELAWPSAPALLGKNKQVFSDLIKARGWDEVVVIDRSGNEVFRYPSSASKAKNYKNNPIFKTLSTEPPGIPAYDFIKTETIAPKEKSAASTEGRLVIACGLSKVGSDNVFAGLLIAEKVTSGLLGVDPKASLRAINDRSPGASFMITRGTGEQIWHSQKPAFTENFSSISPQYQQILVDMQEKKDSYKRVRSYDGQAGIIAWSRIGAWSKNQPAKALMTAVVFFPEKDFPAAAQKSQDQPKAFWTNPVILGLAVIALFLPVFLIPVVVKKNLKPLQRTTRISSDIDEFGAAPEELEFIHEKDPEIQKLNQTLNSLLNRARTAESRVAELDAAMHRIEEQAGHDATISAQELSQLRQKLTGLENEKEQAEVRLKTTQKTKDEIQTENQKIKQHLEQAQHNLDARSNEKKDLARQVQELMKALEELRKTGAKGTGANPQTEEVRLSAVNTLSMELKSTLSVIKNYISAMLGSSSAISDAQQEFLGVVINKSARLERLISDLVTLSEIGAGTVKSKTETIQLSSLVQEVLLNARAQAENKKITIEFAESKDLPQIKTDKNKITQVLTSLLTQAVKVTSRNEKISVLLTGREQGVEIRISDPGMSLSPERAKKVFDQFHGVDSQAGPEYIGTGLRFPIMKATLESIKCKISIESQVGRGKTFVVFVPKDIGDATAPLSSLASMDNLDSSLPMGEVPAKSTPPPIKEKPVLPESLAAPWKKEGSPPPQATIKPPAPKPVGPPPMPGAIPAPPAVKPSLSSADTAKFDELFGAPPAAKPTVPSAPPAPKPVGPPPMPGAIPAPPAVKPSLSSADTAKFDELFGAPPAAKPAAPSAPPAPKPVGPPPMPGAIPAPPAVKPSLSSADTAKFDELFGAPPAAKPAAPSAPPAPKPVGPPPMPGAIPAPPAVKPSLSSADTAKFDELFGAPPTPAPPAPKKETKPAPPALAAEQGGLNNLEDLTRMIQKKP
jgi:signal transduction histidine kinase